MSSPIDSPPVTRRELYSAIAPVWIFLLLILINSMDGDARWPEIVLFVGIAICAVMYSRMGHRKRPL